MALEAMLLEGNHGGVGLRCIKTVPNPSGMRQRLLIASGKPFPLAVPGVVFLSGGQNDDEAATKSERHQRWERVRQNSALGLSAFLLGVDSKTPP